MNSTAIKPPAGKRCATTPPT